MAHTFSDLSRQELNALWWRYYQQLDGPIRCYQVTINHVYHCLASIPESEHTPQMHVWYTLFSEVEDSLWHALFRDLQEIRGEEFATPELQHEYWFTIQHSLLVRTQRGRLYYPLAQQVAQQYGFDLPEGVVPAPAEQDHWWSELLRPQEDAPENTVRVHPPGTWSISREED